MKRIMRVLAVLLLIMAMMSSAVFAAGATVKVDSTDKMAQGSTIKVPVSIEGNTGFSAFGFQMSYDKDALKLIGFEAGSILNGGVTSNIETGKVAYATSSDNKVTADGELFVAIFKVKDKAENGDYKIKAKSDGIGTEEGKMDVSEKEAKLEISDKAPLVNEAEDFDGTASDKKSSDLTAEEAGELFDVAVTDDGGSNGSGESGDAVNKVLIIGIIIVALAVVGCVIALKRKK